MIIAFLIVKTIGKSPTLQAGMDENNNPDCRCSKKKLLLTFAASGQICIVKSETFHLGIKIGFFLLLTHKK